MKICTATIKSNLDPFAWRRYFTPDGWEVLGFEPDGFRAITVNKNGVVAQMRLKDDCLLEVKH